MKKLLSVFAAGMFLFVWFGLSQAMMCDKGMGKGMEMAGEHQMFERLRSLGLDEKQMVEIKAVHQALMKETIKKRAEKEVAGVELRELLEQDPVDVKAAEAKVRQIESLSGDIRIMHIKAHEEIKGKLTPEQRKKFAAMMPMMHGGMMEKMNCDCGMKGKVKKCKKCGMKGKGMMKGGHGDEEADEMPAMGHQHMHHGE